MQQQVAVKVSQSGGSLYVVLTEQLKSLGVNAGDKVLASWSDSGKQIVIRRAN